MDPRHTSIGAVAPTLRVRMPGGEVLRFSRPFHIGRDPDCEVQIVDSRVSRRHAVVSFDDGQWTFRDLQSSNGTFVDGERVDIAAVDGPLTLSLGADGPSLTMELDRPAPELPRPAAPPVPAATVDHDASIANYAERYLSSSEDEEGIGQRTMMIRRAFNEVQKKQKRRYRGIVGVVTVLALIAAGYAIYGQIQIRRQEALAEELFYTMKSLDVQIANVERKLATAGPQGQDQVRRYMEERRRLEANYDRFLAGISSRNLTEQERLILRVTRMLGECELAAPNDYIREVNTYIKRWQSSGRFARATKLAQDMGYTKVIVEELLKQNLAPQFFYLAMQESDFEPFRAGPPTRWGIAKGMWQFIPETGARYGLKIGPMAKVAAPDPEDERLKWDKATPAAARYLKDIYATDAQASGLLVMASYNWGERRVIDLLRTMPADPRERNFWKVLEKHRERLPLQTYDYVFYIVSAAVIGENPRLFGFPFDNPLGFLEKG